MSNIYYIAPIQKTVMSNMDPIEIKDEVKKFTEKLFNGHSEQVHFGGFWGDNYLPNPGTTISINCNAAYDIDGNIVWIISIN